MVNQAGGDLHDVAAALFLHLGDGELRHMEKSGDVDAKNRRVVGLGVLGEGLGDEDAGVVDERVDAPEPRHALGNRALGRLPIGDVAGNRDDVVIVRRPHRARGGDHPVVAITIGFDERRADALRCAGDNRNFLFDAHDTPASCFSRIDSAKADRTVLRRPVSTYAKSVGQRRFAVRQTVFRCAVERRISTRRPRCWAHDRSDPALKSIEGTGGTVHGGISRAPVATGWCRARPSLPEAGATPVSSGRVEDAAVSPQPRVDRTARRA